MLCCIAVITACSTTSALPEGEQLYIGIDKVNYTNYEPGDHFIATQTEVEAALAAEPNGALLQVRYQVRQVDGACHRQAARADE